MQMVMNLPQKSTKIYQNFHQIAFAFENTKFYSF